MMRTTKPSRDLCIMACIFCREPAFWKWMQQLADGQPSVPAANEHAAKAFITTLCQVATRNDIDTNHAAAERFHNLVRKPYLAWREESAQ